jgi:FlaA1/EpsC-like NDP-sugar epimerase
MSKVLVTGATGFLGKYVVKELLSNLHEVVALGNSEIRAKHFEGIFKEVPLYLHDLSHEYGYLKKIIKKHDIEYIIHCAALKHVNLCETNVLRAVEVNVEGTKNIIKAANETNIKNIIGVSTDKSINPSCIYGITKKLAEEMLKSQNFGIFQGVNYFYSTGSVLEIWESQMKKGQKITANKTAIRFFASVQDIAKTIVSNLDTKSVFSTKKCYKISISDLQKAFSIFYDYNKTEEYSLLSIEKTIEELPENMDVVELSVEEICNLIKLYKESEI